MAHLRNQLNTVSEKLDLESLYTRLTHCQNDAKKSFDRLRESTREDIEHKIVSFVEDYCKRLAPDIQSYITSIMATGHKTDASLEVDCLFLFNCKVNYSYHGQWCYLLIMRIVYTAKSYQTITEALPIRGITCTFFLHIYGYPKKKKSSGYASEVTLPLWSDNL